MWTCEHGHRNELPAVVMVLKALVCWTCLFGGAK